MREEYGITKKDNPRDYFSEEELKRVQNAEMLVSSLMGYGWGYNEIKDFTYFEVYSVGMALGQTKESKGKLYPRKERIEGNIKNAEIKPVVHNGQLWITESQLYDLMFETHTERVKPFKKWVTNEVLPSIRKTGIYTMPNSPLDVLELHYQAIKQVDRKVEAIDSRVDALKDELEQVKADIPLFGIEETRIVQAVHRRSIELMGGSGSNASKSKWMKKRVSHCIYDEIHRVYEVKTYKALKRSQCDSAVEVINGYVLPEKVADRIETCNAQMKLGDMEGII